MANPKVFFDVEIGGQDIGRIEFELRRADVVPKIGMLSIIPNFTYLMRAVGRFCDAIDLELSLRQERKILFDEYLHVYTSDSMTVETQFKDF